MKLMFILLLVSMIIIGCQEATRNDDLGVQISANTNTTNTNSTPKSNNPPVVTETVKVSRVNELEAGKSAYAKGSYEEAVQLFGEWIEKNPQDADAYTERGRAHDKLHQYDLALQDFQKALEISNVSLRPRVYITGTLYSAGRTEESYNSLTTVVADAGFSRLGAYERFLIYLLDAQFKLKVNDTEKALKTLDMAMDIYRNNSTIFAKQGSGYIHRLVHQSRSVAYHQQGNYQQVAVELETYVQLSEKGGATVSSKDYMSLAMAYYMTQQFDKCKNLMDKVSPQDRQQLHKILKEDLFIDSDN